MIPCSRHIRNSAVLRPMRSETLPQTMRPSPLRIAYQAIAVPAVIPASVASGFAPLACRASIPKSRITPITISPARAEPVNISSRA